MKVKKLGMTPLLLVGILTVGIVIGAVIVSQSFTARMVVLGAELNLWKDSAFTIQLTTVDFGDIELPYNARARGAQGVDRS